MVLVTLILSLFRPPNASQKLCVPLSVCAAQAHFHSDQLIQTLYRRTAVTLGLPLLWVPDVAH